MHTATVVCTIRQSLSQLSNFFVMYFIMFYINIVQIVQAQIEIEIVYID